MHLFLSEDGEVILFHLIFSIIMCVISVGIQIQFQRSTIISFLQCHSIFFSLHNSGFTAQCLLVCVYVLSTYECVGVVPYLHRWHVFGGGGYKLLMMPCYGHMGIGNWAPYCLVCRALGQPVTQLDLSDGIESSSLPSTLASFLLYFSLHLSLLNF